MAHVGKPVGIFCQCCNETFATTDLYLKHKVKLFIFKWVFVKTYFLVIFVDQIDVLKNAA